MGRRIREALRAITRIAHHYSRDILIALVLAVIAAVLIERYKSWARLETIRNNRRAVATLIVLDQRGRRVEQGSGVFVTRDGLLVTAYHVIEGAADVRARLPSGAIYLLRSILVADEKADIAVLRFDATETPSVTGLGDSDKLQVGEEVYAIGTPAGLEGTVSPGNISNLARPINGRSFIQFTAPISPGSSGGGLFNIDGEVIGITTALWNIPSGSQAGEAQNLNLATPINVVKDVLTGGATGLARESPARYYSLGNLADNKNEWDKARAYYQKALSLDDKYAAAYLGLGGDYYEKGEFELEAANYLKATLLDPQNKDAFYYLGTAYEDLGRYEDAIAAYNRALAIDPQYKDALHDLAILYVAQGRLDQAKQILPKLTVADRGWGNEIRMLIERTSSHGHALPSGLKEAGARP